MEATPPDTLAATQVPRGRVPLRRWLRTSGLEARLRLLAWTAGARRDAWLAPLRSRTPAARARRERQRIERLVAAAGALKGAFVKAGQFASLRYDLLSEEARAALASLQDRVPPLPLAEIRRSLEEELGAPLERRFRAFAPVPVGAASVAQVHRALLPDGRPVAVKVQYPWIEAALPADLRLLRRLLARLDDGRHDLERAFDEFSRGLAEELDFEREAAVAREIAGNLSDDDRVVVPEVVDSHSTRRVLTMSAYDTLRIDRDVLAERGIATGEVLEIVARSYARMVFVDGLFHADPHPGNLYVVDEPDAPRRPRVLFVDFGLSQRLRNELRRELRLGIHALLQRDAEGLVARMQGMGMLDEGAREQALPRVRELLERMGAGGGALALSGSAVLSFKDEAKALLEGTPGLQLPNDLLLYAKTLSYLFGLGEVLDPRVDLMKISVPYLLRFLATRDDEPATPSALR